MDNLQLLGVIDGFLKELGTTGLVDARKARDQLMDLRLLVMADLEHAILPEIITVPAEFLNQIKEVGA